MRNLLYKEQCSAYLPSLGKKYLRNKCVSRNTSISTITFDLRDVLRPALWLKLYIPLENRREYIGNRAKWFCGKENQKFINKCILWIVTIRKAVAYFWCHLCLFQSTRLSFVVNKQLMKLNLNFELKERQRMKDLIKEKTH
jgi:hypothetical protein